MKPCPNCEYAEPSPWKAHGWCWCCPVCGVCGPTNDPTGAKWDALPSKAEVERLQAELAAAKMDNLELDARERDAQDEIQRLRTDLQMARGGTVLEVELAEAQNRATKAESEIQRLRKLARMFADHCHADDEASCIRAYGEIGPIVEDKDNG